MADWIMKMKDTVYMVGASFKMVSVLKETAQGKPEQLLPALKLFCGEHWLSVSSDDTLVFYCSNRPQTMLRISLEHVLET